MNALATLAPVEVAAPAPVLLDLPAVSSPAGADAALPYGSCGEGSPFDYGEGSVGPELGPMDPHLRNTPAARLRAMFATCIVQGLKDGDREWVNDRDFLIVCDYAGLHHQEALAIRKLFNRKKLNMTRLETWNNGPSEGWE